MFVKKRYIVLVWLLMLAVFCGAKTGSANEATPQIIQDELYDKAMALKEEGNNNGALDVLKKIMDENLSKDVLKYTDALIEQCMIMKDANNPVWKTRAIDASQKVKMLYRTNFTNPEYWLVYAKFSALVNKERHVNGAFKKAFYFKPDFIKGYIVKGDLYYYLAKNMDPSSSYTSSSITGETTETNDKSNSPRYVAGINARDAYSVAVNSSTLDNKKKSSLFYKLGELEFIILSNKPAAISNWEKAVELDAESVYGKRAKERLTIPQ